MIKFIEPFFFCSSKRHDALFVRPFARPPRQRLQRAIISNRGNEIRLRALRGSFLGTLHRSPPEDNANFMTRFTRVILSEGAKVDGV